MARRCTKAMAGVFTAGCGWLVRTVSGLGPSGRSASDHAAWDAAVSEGRKPEGRKPEGRKLCGERLWSEGAAQSGDVAEIVIVKLLSAGGLPRGTNRGIARPRGDVPALGNCRKGPLLRDQPGE
jgi:hypothetical protein